MYNLMNFIQNLFKNKKEEIDNSNNNIIKRFREVDYKYSCSICKTDKVKIKIIGLTEAFYGPFVDSSGNTHTHDYNSGEVELICDNNHKTTTKYIACCECGWTNNKS